MSELIYLQSNEIKKSVNKIDSIEDKTLIATVIEIGMRVSEITQSFKIEMINSLQDFCTFLKNLEKMSIEEILLLLLT